MSDHWNKIEEVRAKAVGVVLSEMPRGVDSLGLMTVQSLSHSTRGVMTGKTSNRYPDGIQGLSRPVKA